MKDCRSCLLVASLSLLATSGCSYFYGSMGLKQSGTIVVKPDKPYIVTFDAPRPVLLELRFDNRGPGTLEFRESIPGSEMHTVTKSGGRMSVKGELDRVAWVLTSNEEAVATYVITSNGSGSLAVHPK